jgi:hypothetical protein
MKHTVIYLGSDPFLEVIVICPVVWYKSWIGVTRGEQRSQKVHVVKGEIDLVPPAWRVRGLL